MEKYELRIKKALFIKIWDSEKQLWKVKRQLWPRLRDIEGTIKKSAKGS
jgi:hypothetical protein